MELDTLREPQVLWRVFVIVLPVVFRFPFSRGLFMLTAEFLVSCLSFPHASALPFLSALFVKSLLLYCYFKFPSIFGRSLIPP